MYMLIIPLTSDADAGREKENVYAVIVEVAFFSTVTSTFKGRTYGSDFKNARFLKGLLKL
jgi:hypothetical protein